MKLRNACSFSFLIARVNIWDNTILGKKYKEKKNKKGKKYAQFDKATGVKPTGMWTLLL